MAIRFPQDCITSADRTEYCYQAQELLRLDHNKVGLELKENKISKVEWLDYKINTFDPKQEKIVKEILKQRAILKKSIRWNIDIKAI